MHKLDRTCPKPPACLTTHDHRTHTWHDLAAACKHQLRAALVEMQGTNEYGVRCAYCEGTIHDGGHIEHFRRKRHHPDLTFAWANLFLACGSYTHCGHYKDRRHAPAYDPDQLIKPDEADPAAYLFFHSSGEVRPHSDMDARDVVQAQETIRVFGLNDQALAGKRAKALMVYKRKILTDLDEVANWPDIERHEYFDQEIKATSNEPYASSIRCFLQVQGDA